MKYKYTVLFGILIGIVMSILCKEIPLGIAFASCGSLFGYAIDMENNSKNK